MDKVFTEKKATALTSSDTVLYPVYAVMLHSTPDFRRFLIVEGYTFAGFFPKWTSTDVHNEPEGRIEKHKLKIVWSIVLLSDVLPARIEKDARLLNLQVIHDILRELHQTLNDIVCLG